MNAYQRTWNEIVQELGVDCSCLKDRCSDYSKKDIGLGVSGCSDVSFAVFVREIFRLLLQD